MYEAAATDELICSHTYANRVKDNDVFKKMQMKMKAVIDQFVKDDADSSL